MIHLRIFYFLDHLIAALLKEASKSLLLPAVKTGFLHRYRKRTVPEDHIIFAGLLFALWGLLWKTTIDGKTIRVNPVIGRKKVVPFTDLKKAVVYKKKKTGSIVSYELIDKNDKPIVTIYPLMKDSSTLMERLKRLKYPVEEA